jgi:aspartate/methionine/tyrosine aminotransferase
MVDPAVFAVAQRADVPPFQVMEVLSAAAARQRVRGDVVSLAAGQPASPAPRAVREAAVEALHRHSLGYTEQLGIPELRDSIAAHYQRTYGLAVDREDVVLTTGASGGFLLAFLAAFDAGDRVALARPGYPAYRNILRALGCTVVELPCDSSTRFQPTVEMLEELDEPVQGLIVASPANPTGTVLGSRELADLSDWCARRGVRLISDEIYHGISYGEPLSTAWEFSRESVVMQSFSKLWCMTGWRLGWMLLPERLRRAVDSLTGNFTLCPPAVSQYGALGAFSHDAYEEVAGHVEQYRTNRELLLTGLAELGIDRVAPADGAFYVYADVRHLTDDSMVFCRRLLDDTGVAVVPGVDFDPVDGHHFVRMSFASSTEDVAEALGRLAQWLRK